MIVGERPPSPFVTLTRHFFSSFFRPSFLDDAGEESLKRGLIGLLAAIVAMNVLLIRLYAVRYAAMADPEQMAGIVAADRLFIIALPMFVTAVVMALVSHSLFPDDVDFMTLTALPLDKSTIFAAKFTALALFAAIFIASINIGIALPLSLIVNGRLPDELPVLSTPAQLLANVWSCVFVVLCAAALQGLLVVALPRRWLHMASLWTQTGAVSALVLAVPFLLRTPGLGHTLERQPAWLFGVPPAWFLGVQQWLLGRRNPYSVRLLATALAATAIAAAVCTLCSVLMYRRFDRSALRRAGAPRPVWWNVTLHWQNRTHQARAAIRDFMSATIRRSGLHQLVFFTAFAVGCALAVNSLIGSIGLTNRWIVQATLAAPFTVMAGAGVGLRAALLLPTTLRAGWVFRVTEQDAMRAYQLDAVHNVLLFSGVAVPTVLALPVQVAQLGVRTAIVLVPITLTIGWTFVEVMCLDWRRLPFTCTFLFAKRPPAVTVFLIIAIFGWFPFLGASLLNTARVGVIPWLIVLALVLSAWLPLRWYRAQNWGRWPLEFEDYLPDGLDSLRLGN